MNCLRSLAPLLVAIPLSDCAGPLNGAVGSADYAPQYDFSEFYAAADGKTFVVSVVGNPFPAIATSEMRRHLLPVLQANAPPRPKFTFTYDQPAERPHPFYRLYVVFGAANDLTAARVCADQVRLAPGPGGRVDVFAVYCRNEQALSQATGSVIASSPEDPQLGNLFSKLFLALFPAIPIVPRPFPPARPWMRL